MYMPMWYSNAWMPVICIFEFQIHRYVILVIDDRAYFEHASAYVLHVCALLIQML